MNRKIIYSVVCVFLLVLGTGVVSAKNFKVIGNGNNLFFINGTSGLIGFNTTTPQNTLNVVGNGNFTGNLYVNGEQVGGSGTFVPYTGATANLDLGNNNFSIGTSELFVNSNTGNVGIGTTAPSQKLDVIGSASISGNLAVNTNNLYVDSATGNVGIGTTTPGRSWM